VFVCIIAAAIGLGRVLMLRKRGKTLGKVYTNSLFAWLQIMAWGGVSISYCISLFTICLIAQLIQLRFD
jgi:uncharacterized membrane protein